MLLNGAVCSRCARAPFCNNRRLLVSAATFLPLDSKKGCELSLARPRKGAAGSAVP